MAKGLKRLSHKLTSEEVQIVEAMIKVHVIQKEIESLENKKRILKELLSLGEKELRHLSIDSHYIKKIVVDHEIKREIRMKEGERDGVAFWLSQRKFKDLEKKIKKIMDEESN